MKHKELKKQVAFWHKKKQSIQNELDQVNTIITDLQNLCKHQYPNGTSAVQDDAFASPYSQKICQICGKVFGD